MSNYVKRQNKVGLRSWNSEAKRVW